jgi:TolA-binding protein
MSQTQNLELKNAQTHFENGDYAKAILTLTGYLQNAPQSENTSEAEYLLGQSYTAIGDTERASTYFERSKLKKGLLKSAQIDFQIGFFQSAISKFEKVLKSYADENEQIEAKIGLIKAYFVLKNYERVMYYLTELKNSYAPHTHPVEHLYFGKLYFSQGQLDEAKTAFEKVIHATNDVYAAEAQYFIGLIYREQGDYLSSNEELYKVKGKYQSYSVWVYEALFAIADNYISLDNLFQAKATMQWIIDNSQDAKMNYRAKEKLMEWEK